MVTNSFMKAIEAPHSLFAADLASYLLNENPYGSISSTARTFYNILACCCPIVMQFVRWNWIFDPVTQLTALY